MPNIIRIDWSMEELRLTLFNMIKQDTEHPDYYEIESVENNLLGMKQFNCEFIQYVLEKCIGKKRSDALAPQVEKYFNKGVIGELAQIKEVLSKNYTQEFNEKIICEIEGRRLKLDYKTYVEDIIQKTGLEQRVERLIERMKSNCLQYPIDYIVVDKNVEGSKWLSKFVKEIFKDIPIKSQNVNSDIKHMKQQKSLKETSELILKYKGEEFVLLNQEQMEKPKLSEIAYFKVKFSLDIAIEFTIIEKWRQDGKSNTREIAIQRFYHPMFYTGEQMKLLINREKGQYNFKLTHMETGMEIYF